MHIQLEGMFSRLIAGLPDGTFMCIFWRAFDWNMLHILWPFRKFYGCLVYFVVIWHSVPNLPKFVVSCNKKN
jgi:hypothetical protein